MIEEFYNERQIPGELFERYNEVFELMKPEERKEITDKAVKTLTKYILGMKKRKGGYFETGERIDLLSYSIEKKAKFHLFNAYIERILDRIPEEYRRIGGTTKISRNFVLALYKHLEKNFPLIWWKIIRGLIEFFSKAFCEGDPDSDKKLFVLGVIAGMVIFYLDYTKEGFNEIEGVSETAIKNVESMDLNNL
jgi:hypothetical protein